jgi:hypothetical protein
MSRVSKQAKQKMAEIAKEDIVIQLEKNVERIVALNPTQSKPKRKYTKRKPKA